MHPNGKQRTQIRLEKTSDDKLWEMLSTKKEKPENPRGLMAKKTGELPTKEGPRT